MTAILAAVGMAIAYGLKVNLSVAIVAMVNHTALGNRQNREGTVTIILLEVLPIFASP